jgi:hypothetical protein
MLKIATIATASMWTTSVVAAPFCVVSSAGRDCSYVHSELCLQAARAAHGSCVAQDNPRPSPSDETQVTGSSADRVDERVPALEGAADTSSPDVSPRAAENQMVLPVYPPVDHP